MTTAYQNKERPPAPMAKPQREPIAYLVCSDQSQCIPFRGKRKRRLPFFSTQRKADAKKQGGRCFICGNPQKDMMAVEFMG